MKFKERVKAIREHFHLTQKQFAEKLGISRNTISKYEYEGRNPEGPIVELVCREFGVSRDWLLEGKGAMFLLTRDDLIDEAAQKYSLDELDKAILRLYLSLDGKGRAHLRRVAVELADAVNRTPGLMSLLRDERPLSREEEADEVAAQVHDAILNGGEKASESGMPLVGSGTA